MSNLIRKLKNDRDAPPGVLFDALATDVEDRSAGTVNITGRLPQGLSGVLYRNGPGKFRRGGRTKRSVLDGDGVIQRLELADGRARYARRFVRTPKLAAETAANRFLYPTWTTTAPGFLANVGQHIESQAGITVYSVNGKLLVLDEVAPGFELDPATLETLRPASLGLPENDRALKAHARFLVESGDWLFVSTRTDASGTVIDLVRLKPDGTRIATPTVKAPRTAYLHDFGATERFAVVILQAAHLHGLRFLSGLASFAECLEWRPERGNIVLLIDLHSGACRTFEAPAAWVWHVANAYEHDNDLVMDFVGYDDPGHFLGRDAQLTAIMRGREGVNCAPGTLRRYVIRPESGRLTETILCDGNYEFPSVDGRSGGREHQRVYVTCGNRPGMLHSGIASIDTATGKRDAYDFGAHVNALEPVFAQAPDGAIDQGWLITQTLDTRAGTSAFAVLDARCVADGPVATIELGETLPISFHGLWVPH